MTLELKELGTVQVTVEPDKAKTKENLEEFVSMFNEAYIPIARELKVTEDTDYGSSLAGDSSIKRIKLAIQTAVTSSVPGTTGTWNALSEIGLEMDATGKMTIDSEKLDEALDKDIAGIADLFTIETHGLSDKLTAISEPYIDDLEGTFKEKVDSYNDRIDLLDDEIEDQRWRIEKMVARLTVQFANIGNRGSELQLPGRSIGGSGLNQQGPHGRIHVPIHRGTRSGTPSPEREASRRSLTRKTMMQSPRWSKSEVRL